MEDKIGILTFEQWHSTVDIGSSRIRGSWIADNWLNAELFVIGRKYSIIIFQKAYWIDYASTFDGIKILDVCDPDFLDWNSPCIAMADRCDAVTASTQLLASVLSQYTKTPCYCIPDRLHPDLLDVTRKIHKSNGVAQTVAWFGYSANYPSLDLAIPDLLHYGITRLIVISRLDTPYVLPAYAVGRIQLTFIEWNFDTLSSHLFKADLVINYRLDYGRWRYKSDNKSVLSWAFGLPVAHSACELEAFLSDDARESEACRRLAQVRAQYDIEQTIREFQSIVGTVRCS